MSQSNSSPSPNLEVKAEGLFQEGVIKYDEGEYTDAIAKYQEALRIFRELSSSFWIARTLNALGLTSHNLALSEDEPVKQEKALSDATQFYQESLGVSSEDRVRVAETLTNLGQAYKKLKNYLEAIEAYQKALAIYNQELQALQGVEEKKINILRELGFSYKQLKQYDEAEKHYQQVVEALDVITDESEQADVLIELGDFYFNKGEKVKEDAQNSSASRDETIGLEEFSAALEFFYKAWQIYKGTESRNEKKSVLKKIVVASQSAEDAIQQGFSFDDDPPTLISSKP